MIAEVLMATPLMLLIPLSELGPHPRNAVAEQRLKVYRPAWNSVRRML
jgi:hypothetical protein